MENIYKGFLKCAVCGKGCSYQIDKDIVYHRCTTSKKFGTKACDSKRIREDILNDLVRKVLEVNDITTDLLQEKVDYIEIGKESSVTFHLKDGKVLKASFEKEQAPIQRNHLFSRYIKCGKCGKYFVYKTGAYRPFYICSNVNDSLCNQPRVREDAMIDVTKKVLKAKVVNESLLLDRLDYIECNDDNLTFHLKNRRTINEKYIAPSRLWTEEMKEKVRTKNKGEIDSVKKEERKKVKEVFPKKKEAKVTKIATIKKEEVKALEKTSSKKVKEDKALRLTDRYNNKYVIENGVLVASLIVNTKIAIPDGVVKIEKRSMLTKTIRELYIPSTVEEISDNMCGTLVTISHLYYDGSFDDFEKIKFTSFSRWKSLKTKIKRLSVKNDKDEYYKVMTNTESLYETRGIDLSLLNTLLARDEEKIVKACEERLNNNSYISYVSYYDDFFRIIIEAKYDTLSNEIKEFLYDNKICILADDCLINYRVDRFTKVTPMPNYKEDKRHPAPPSILMNEVGRFSYSTKVVNISKDTKTIGKEFSEEAHHVVIYYDGLVEDWFNIEVNCDLKGYIVRCIDGTIQYVSVNHNKVDFELYYSGVHLLNSYIIRYVNTLSFRKVFWGFVDHNLLAAIASNNSHKMKSYAHNYHDYNDDEEYNIYDYHNFKKIKVFDFEAG